MEEEEIEDSYKEKTDYKVNIKNNLLESNNEKEEENEDENRDNDLNGSNSSINTKVYKLNGTLESFVKKDIINDNNINNKIDELKNKTLENISISQKKSKNVKSNNYFNEVINEEPLNEEEDEKSIQDNKKENNVNDNDNVIKENNDNITIDDQKIFKLFNSSYTNNIKQESTKESIQFNSKASDFKGNNEKPGSIILVQNNNNESKKEEPIVKEDDKIINKNKDIKQVQVQNNNNKSKVKVSTKKENKFGQIMGPTEPIKKRSKSISNNNDKKVKNKDCIIF